MISAATLDGMRATLNASLPDDAVIQRIVKVDDGQGGFIEGTPTIVASPKVRVSTADLTREENTMAERVGIQTAWILTFPAETDVTAKDRIVVGGRTFEVAAVLRPRSWEISRRVLAREFL